MTVGQSRKCGNYCFLVTLPLLLMAWMIPSLNAFHSSYQLASSRVSLLTHKTKPNNGFFHRRRQQQQNRVPPLLAMSSSSSSKQLEVEQKFSLANNASNVESRLRQLGFEPKQPHPFVMVDWYFDNDHLSLTTRDRWLRFRETKKKQGAESSSGDNGCWELKVGRKTKTRGGDTTTTTTVYEELVGDEAISTTLDFLKKDDDDVTTTITNHPPNDEENETLEGHAIPKIPDQISSGLLRAFARIETHRSSWIPKSANSFPGLCVDLDNTNFGYAVGEVETVVQDNDEVPKARERVQSLIDKLTENNDHDNSGGGSSNDDNKEGTNNQPAVGKLEYYLIHNRPDHYAACIQSGSMRTSSK